MRRSIATPHRLVGWATLSLAAVLSGCAAGGMGSGLNHDRVADALAAPEMHAPDMNAQDGSAAFRGLEAALARDAAQDPDRRAAPSEAAAPALTAATPASAPAAPAASAPAAAALVAPTSTASAPQAPASKADRIARRAPRFELLPPMTGGPEAAEEEEAEAVKRLPEPPAPQGPAQTSPQPVQQAAAASASALGPPPQAEWRETALGSCVAATPRPAPAPDCAAAPASEAQSCAAQAARAERLNQIVASLAPRRCASRTDLAAAQSALRWLGAPRLEITGALDEPTIAAMRAFGASDPSLTVAPTKDFIGAVLSAGAARKVAAQKSAAAEDGSDDPWRRFLDEPDPRVAFVTADQSAGLHVHCVRGADDRLRLFFFTKTPAPAAALLRLKDAGGGEATARLVDLGDQGAPDRPLFAMATALGDQAAAEAKRVADFMLDARGEVTFELGDPNAPASAFYRAGFDAERASGAAADLLAVCRI